MKILWALLLIFLWNPVAMAAEEESPQTLLKKSQECMQDEDYDCAVEALRKILAMEPGLAQVHNLLGLAYTKQEGFVQSAIVEFEEAAALDPRYAEPYFNLGTLHAGTLQDPEAALDYFERALRADPGYARAHFAMAWIYLFEKKDVEKALSLFKATLEKIPQLAEAQYGMALCYLQLNKRELALEPISRMREMNREDLASKIESFMQTGDVNKLAKTPQPGSPAAGAPQPSVPGGAAPAPAAAPSQA